MLEHGVGSVGKEDTASVDQSGHSDQATARSRPTRAYKFQRPKSRASVCGETGNGGAETARDLRAFVA